MSTLAHDLPAGRIDAALRAVAAATARLVAAVDELDAGGLDAPSLLPGWSRRTLLAHLHKGASASARMTRNALATGAATFYPGGAAERSASLRAFDGTPASALRERFTADARALVADWRDVAVEEWLRVVDGADYGPLAVSRLVVLRLNELTVHGEDLDIGLGWAEPFVELALPLRLAWLPTHHHGRTEADHTVRATWLLTDGVREWLVSADGGRASVEAVQAATSADATLHGSPQALLRLLLGRLPARALLVDGDPAVADRFKAVFPGP